MPIIAISGQNNNVREKLTTISRNTSATDLPQKPDFKSSSYAKNVSKKTQIGVFFTTLAGLAIPMAMILKKKGLSLNPLKSGLKDFKVAFKSWGPLHINYEDSELPKVVLKLGAGSVLGGLVGGALFDKKEHMKAKCREAVIQFIGNISTPLACVSGGLALFKKIEPKLVNLMPKVKDGAKNAELLNRISKGTPGVIASLALLTAGVLLGNKVGNYINEKIFKVKDNRKIKMCDMSPHIDDLCIATSFAAASSPIGPIIKRVIPAALVVAGVSTGITQERPERLACK